MPGFLSQSQSRGSPLENWLLSQPQRMGQNSSGRPMYYRPDRGRYSEKSVTFPLMGKWITFPSVDAQGNLMGEDQVLDYVRANGPVDPITGEELPMFKSRDEAERYARMRSRTR
jgi:hypothetical protein